MSEATLAVIESKAIRRVFGDSDVHLRTIRESLGIRIILDGNELLLQGEPEAVRMGAVLLERLQRFAARGNEIAAEDVQRALLEVRAGADVSGVKPIEVFGVQRVRPKTAGEGEKLPAP